MHQHYEDILKRIDQAPIWFDEFGLPRYDEFSPQRLSNIYATEAALAEVFCQQCKRPFRVALTNTFARNGFGLSDEIRLNRVHYGDPPNVRCCAAGPVMNSVMHEILEYWTRDHEAPGGWQRNTLFEGPIGKPQLDLVDSVAQTLAAVRSGARALIVQCTTRQYRYNIAGRITAALANDRHVLVLCPDTYSLVARKMLDGLVPDADIGADGKVHVSLFSRLGDIDVTRFGGVVILAGPAARNKTEQKTWEDTSRQIESLLSDKTKIEFALPHSRCMIESPEHVLDADELE